MDKIVGHVKSASLHKNLDFKEHLAPVLFKEIVSPSPHRRHLQHLLQLHLHQGTQAPPPQPGTNAVTSFQEYTDIMTRE